MPKDQKNPYDGRVDQAEQNREEEARGAKTPDLRRQGERSGAGSDTPSGPDTTRDTTAAKREVDERNERGTKDRTEAEEASQTPD